jgi:starch-binding outer membrane protein, SusD/RagB family
MKTIIRIVVILMTISVISCDDDFLDTAPLSAISDATYWESENNAIMWINYAYRSLPNHNNYLFDTFSDDATGNNANDIQQGLHNPSTGTVGMKWGYQTIRHCLELLEKIDNVPNLSTEAKNRITGQARFILAYDYFEKITLYRDIPLVDKTMRLEESDLPKTEKSIILTYVLQQLDLAIDELPLSWPASEAGRATQGAALALKARVLLYNNRWEEAAAAAKQVMDLGVYELHPNYDEVFMTAYNNATKEVILAHQYAEGLYVHNLQFPYSFYTVGGTSGSLPLPSLVNSYESIDGLPIDESLLYDPLDPWENRDPRFRMNHIVPFDVLDGVTYDPVNDINDRTPARTYVYFRKYIADMKTQQRTSHVNWILLRYADVLLMYAEAKNEASGPEASIYDALDLIRERAGMPPVDRARYSDQASLRSFIRNERRVELAGEGLRYFDILRWRIAEDVLNTTLVSFEIPDLLPLQVIRDVAFDPQKHYVWPIPQSAIDNAKNLEQHPEWR